MSSASQGHSSRVRRKVDIELVDPAVCAAVGSEQIEYYRRRAPWYDDVYDCVGDYDRGPELNADWRRSVAALKAVVDRVPLHGDCVELGIGTGFWTAHMVDRVDRLSALDSAPEMLDRARRRLGDRPEIEFAIVDLWRWQPEQRWDCAVAFFFIEHVPDEILPTLLTTMHLALGPGGCFFVAEGAWWQPEPPVETREVDGRSLRVVERRRTPDELRAVFNEAGFDVEIGTVDEYVHLTATRRPRTMSPGHGSGSGPDLGARDYRSPARPHSAGISRGSERHRRASIRAQAPAAAGCTVASSSSAERAIRRLTSVGA